MNSAAEQEASQAAPKPTLPPGTYWLEIVKPAPVWQEWAHAMGFGQADEQAKLLADAIAVDISRLSNGRGKVKWNYYPPGMLESAYGSDAVLFVTLQTDVPIVWDAASAKKYEALWTPWRGPGLPGPNDVEGFPKVETWQQALTEYVQDVVDIPKKAVSGALVGLAVIGGIGLGVYLLTRRRKG